jgi:hypothetical protein
MSLSDRDRDSIRETIDDEVLKGTAIEFASTTAREAAGGVGVDGELRAAARLCQSDWGMKPYSGMFGALKVADELAVEVEGRLAAD